MGETMKNIGYIIVILTVMTFTISVVPFILMLAWNYIASYFGLPEINFWVAFAFVVIINIVFNKSKD